MNLRIGNVLGVALLAGMAALAVAAQPRPLADGQRAPVATVSPGPVQVPIITWGGDIATILANGNAKATDKASLFGKHGLNLRLVREDVFERQLDAYLSGRSPYLRGTLGMIHMAAESAGRDARTRPVVVYQMTWSAGGDALVVKSGIKTAKDLRGKTIALQAYGPHIDYLGKVLADAGLSLRDVNLRWLDDLTGTKNSPATALRDSAVDAALVIIPDAMALTSRGAVGTGAEDSVKGARILLSTKTANRIITDVYAVRADYLQSNRGDVEQFVRGLVQGEQALRQLFANRSAQTAEYGQTMRAAAQILMDSPQAVADVEGMIQDAEFVGVAGNKAFFSRAGNPRGFSQLNAEIQSALTAVGLVRQKTELDHARFDFDKLAGSATAAPPVETQRFDSGQVTALVARRQQQGKLSEGELFSFEVFFKPNQDSFPVEQYKEAFNEVIKLASTYGGAVITVEGHSDPMGFLQAKKAGSAPVVLSRTQQSAKNLSLSRANAVRDSIVNFAHGRGITLDPSQFAVVGHGIQQPRTGMCGGDPCPPKTEQEWYSNMRVEFRIIQIEAEASAFKPL